MLLVLCPTGDLDALWLVGALRRAGTSCTVATTEMLSFARRRSHRIGRAGITTAVDLADGTALSGQAGVLNRLVDPPDTAWRSAAAGERDYAAAELQAFVLAWLSGLDRPMRNRPDPACLAGRLPSPLEVAHAAARAGLACGPLRLGADRPATDLLAAAVSVATGPVRPLHLPVLDGDVVAPGPVRGGVPDGVCAGIRTLVADLGMAEALVGLDFLVDRSTWWLAGLSPLAGLRSGGEPLVRRLAQLLDPAGAAP